LNKEKEQKGTVGKRERRTKFGKRIYNREGIKVNNMMETPKLYGHVLMTPLPRQYRTLYYKQKLPNFFAEQIGKPKQMFGAVYEYMCISIAYDFLQPGGGRYYIKAEFL